VQHPEPLNVIRRKAKSVGSPLFVLGEQFFVRQNNPLQDAFRYEANFPVALTLDDLSLKMSGSHQRENASAAISAFLLLKTGSATKRSDGFVRRALQNAFLPLRFEIRRSNDESPTFIFDGAHNRSSMQAFIKTVEEAFPNRRLLLIFGASLEKDVEGMFAEIGERFHHIFLTQYSESSRRFPPRKLRSIFALPDTQVSTVENCKDAWGQCLRMAEKEDVVCITGSLYLAAELRLLGESFSASE
jgi:dihydrofolate synthase/folylpolyglutamate synthase